MIAARGSGENSDASPYCFAISFAGSSAGAFFRGCGLEGLNCRSLIEKNIQKNLSKQSMKSTRNESSQFR